MRAIIKQQFSDGLLTPRSELSDIKHIGEYLYKGLKRTFAPNLNNLSIRTFSNKIKRLTLSELKTKLQSALQNKRNNQCINDKMFKYHVPDYNRKGYEAMINLIKVLARNEDGYRLGNNFSFNANQLRMPPARSDDTKFVSCLSRQTCRRNGGNWNNGMCHPSSNSQGFSGIHPYSGQKTKPRNSRHKIGSINNSIRRGRYVNSPNSQIMWRKPGKMRKL